MKQNKNVGNLIFRIMLFVSSYIPLYILVFINNIKIVNNSKKVTRKISYYILETANINKYISIGLLLLTVVGIFALIILFRNKANNRQKKFQELKSLNVDILNYFITYLIPLLTMEFDDIISVIVNVIIFIIIGIFYVSENQIHLNIIYIMLGYKVYKDKEDNIVISNYKNLDNGEDVNYTRIGDIYIVKEN